jgi:phospholipid/cholesterol/gamma-HCH transport system substrate-binding protein
MNSRALEIAVGVFVAAGIAALFMLAMKVSNLSTYTGEGGYTLKANFENIGGLTLRSPVRISGVRIGHVTGIDYNSNLYEAVVTMVIGEQYQHLPKDTSASIYTAGLLGEQYISLSPGADATYLKNGDVIQHTQSALVLEQMIGQFLFNKAAEGSQK